MEHQEIKAAIYGLVRANMEGCTLWRELVDR